MLELHCSFDIPRAQAPAGRSPRLELFYDSLTGKFAGDEIPLDDLPRFENRYARQMVTTGPSGGGLRPQVEGFREVKSVEFGSTGYRIEHPATGLFLEHDTTTPTRRANAQDDLKKSAAKQRLEAGSLAPFRRVRQAPVRTHPLKHPKLDVSTIRRRTPV